MINSKSIARSDDAAVGSKQRPVQSRGGRLCSRTAVVATKHHSRTGAEARDERKVRRAVGTGLRARREAGSERCRRVAVPAFECTGVRGARAYQFIARHSFLQAAAPPGIRGSGSARLRPVSCRRRQIRRQWVKPGSGLAFIVFRPTILKAAIVSAGVRLSRPPPRYLRRAHDIAIRMPSFNKVSGRCRARRS